MGNPINTKSWNQLLDLSDTNNQSNIGKVEDTNLSLSIDFSKSFIAQSVWDTLIELAKEQNVETWRDKMFAGEKINTTEDRSVWHVALRSGQQDVVLNELSRMKDFVDKTHKGNQFTDVVHIGIGGSDLGPRLVCDALKHLEKKLNVHFVANVDAADIEEVLKPLNPKTTLFVIASKTFTTQETMMNATYAKKWLGGLSVEKHMIALSTNAEGVANFGIDTNNMFPFWDWVGGRFSVWSAIGMPIALAYGYDIFQQFLNGAKSMDNHFSTKTLDQNLPVLLALFGIWNRNFKSRSAIAVLPYAQNLALLSNFLQQLDMESNGKSADREGDFITEYKTGPVVFGQAGTNGQHAFHQWLHQGTEIVPSEIIIIKNSSYDAAHQNVLNANAFAQAEAFSDGFENIENKHKHYEGGRPSVNIELEKLTPTCMGELIALYEHKVFVQGIIWNINSFDQFGVELGKKLAQNLLTN